MEIIVIASRALLGLFETDGVRRPLSPYLSSILRQKPTLLYQYFPSRDRYPDQLGEDIARSDRFRYRIEIAFLNLVNTTMKPKLYICPHNVADDWWKSLEDHGCEVFLTATDDRAKNILRDFFGHNIWDDEVLDDKSGGVVIANDASVWVAIHLKQVTSHRFPDRTYELLIVPLPPKNIFHSRETKKLVTIIREELLKQGVRPYSKREIAGQT